MTTIDLARSGSHLVRSSVLSFVISFVPAVIVAEKMVGPPSEPDHQQVVLCDHDPCDADRPSAAAAAMVDHLVGQGLRCTVRPRLTDTVVVEWLGGEAAVLPFDEALEVAAHRRGWLRSYCVPGAGR
ncbi:hypothetical protein QE370_003146 [Aeromicrobium sp. SORGH_AS981]|uniref:hypothetical protein n=1 Tax=Aeromicrobium sp. SORGH_AS_0981 TaxID=3041802 RepID=UPI00285E79F2|nr:hypothetical protein [Aeromicrobium sp. SORGH_AS_0981]MDR6119962.1 hypothetical protein [Aeromicrobium sp. SORGH_AS_0981]